MIERRLEGLWSSLQGKKPHLPHFFCRIVARLEANQRDSDIRPLADELQRILLQWREWS